jgi:hypothetical protein
MKTVSSVWLRPWLAGRKDGGAFFFPRRSCSTSLLCFSSLTSAGPGLTLFGKAEHDQAPSPPVDTLNRDGAIALAKRLQQYWHDQGYPAARFWTEPLDERFAKISTYEVCQVRCNLVNGLPPRYRDESE